MKTVVGARLCESSFFHAWETRPLISVNGPLFCNEWGWSFDSGLLTWIWDSIWSLLFRVEGRPKIGSGSQRIELAKTTPTMIVSNLFANFVICTNLHSVTIHINRFDHEIYTDCSTLPRGEQTLKQVNVYGMIFSEEWTTFSLVGQWPNVCKFNYSVYDTLNNAALSIIWFILTSRLLFVQSSTLVNCVYWHRCDIGTRIVSAFIRWRRVVMWCWHVTSHGATGTTKHSDLFPEHVWERDGEKRTSWQGSNTP